MRSGLTALIVKTKITFLVGISQKNKQKFLVLFFFSYRLYLIGIIIILTIMIIIPFFILGKKKQVFKNIYNVKIYIQ